MNPSPEHPLSPEERALAERLRRLGPHDGPPPSLDAKILAAARAATAPRMQRRRRFALTGLPASFLTAAGTAAAFVLAVGLVWQLRPDDRPPVRRAVSSAPADDGFVMAEMIVTRDNHGTTTAPSIASAPAASATAAAGEPASAIASREPLAHAVSAPMESGIDASARVAEAAPAAPVPDAAPADADLPGETASADTAAAIAADAPAAEPTTQADQRNVRSRASYTRSALATAERPAARVRTGPAPAATAAAAPLPVSVDPDAALPPADWLQRVRDRRDAGDMDGARESLRRFRAAHPRVRIPSDLRRLPH